MFMWAATADSTRFLYLSGVALLAMTSAMTMLAPALNCLVLPGDAYPGNWLSASRHTAKAHMKNECTQSLALTPDLGKAPVISNVHTTI